MYLCKNINLVRHTDNLRYYKNVCAFCRTPGARNSVGVDKDNKKAEILLEL